MPRPFLGWLAFFLVVGLLIALQLQAYLSRDDQPRTNRDAQTADQALRMTLEPHAGLSGFLGPDRAPKLNLTTLTAQLPKLERAGASEEAAVVAIAIRQLDSKEPAPSSLETLRKSKSEKFRRVLQLVENPPKAEPGVRSLRSNLPDLFSARVIWALALEKAGVEGARKEVISAEAGVRLMVIGVLVTLGFALGVIVWIFYLVQRGTGGLRPPSEGFPTPNSEDADRMAGKATQLLGLFFLVPFAAMLLFGSSLPPAAQLALPILIIVLTLLALRLPILGGVITFRQAGLHRDLPVGKGLLWTAGVLLAEIPLLVILAAISSPLQQFFPPAEHPITVKLAEGVDLVTLISTFMMASLLAPIVEELIFRGLLAPAMMRLFRSTALGLVIAALCFAAIHPTGIPAWLPLAGVGFMSSLLYLHTRALWPSMLFHAIHNTAILTIALTVFG